MSTHTSLNQPASVIDDIAVLVLPEAVVHLDGQDRRQLPQLLLRSFQLPLDHLDGEVRVTGDVLQVRVCSRLLQVMSPRQRELDMHAVVRRSIWVRQQK